MSRTHVGCRLTFQGHVITCNVAPDFEANYERCRMALAVILDRDPFKQDGDGWCEFWGTGGSIESYYNPKEA